MASRTLRALPGIVASALLASAPAYAHAQSNRSGTAKYRTASLHRRDSRNIAERHGTAGELVDDLVENGPSADDLNGRELAHLDPTAPLRPAEPQPTRPAPREPLETGIASWYGSHWAGRRTASGSIYDPSELTAAHPWLPLGSRVRVTVLGSNRSVEVTITDRPGNHHRIIDLSREAARSLGILSRGTARVALSRL